MKKCHGCDGIGWLKSDNVEKVKVEEKRKSGRPKKKRGE